VPSGTVKWFNVTKGYGFIAPDRGGKDVFVPTKAVQKAGSNVLVEGGKVAFDVVEYRGKQAAENLRVDWVRTLIAIMMVALMASSSAFARKASHHHSKRTATPKHQSATKTDPGGVARDPADVELDRKIGSICRGC
jgi:CspA family cold shock protein